MTTPGAADPSRIELSRDGEVLGRFHRFDAEPPVAELFEPNGDLVDVVEAVFADLAGWSLTTTHDPLADALVRRGATPTRHFSLMSVDLRSIDLEEHSAEGQLLRSLSVRRLRSEDPIPPEVVPLVRSAYPPGHADEEHGSDEDIIGDIQRAQSGGRLGPLMDQSAFFFDAERLVAMLLINRVPGAAPLGGPWVTDVCRAPDSKYAGLGRTMLLRLMRLLIDNGEAALSLAVTEGNPARRLYEALGFTVVATTRKVRVPL
ncbi:MAG: GNAT family N-acetyltransferase [Actinomycetes bacterium]